MDIFEVINSQRAMRRLKPDPVPEELIWKLLDAAIKAPSGGNRQPWNFIVIRDDETKAKIAEWYLDGWNKAYGPLKQAAKANPTAARTYASADHLANHLAEVGSETRPRLIEAMAAAWRADLESDRRPREPLDKLLARSRRQLTEAPLLLLACL